MDLKERSPSFLGVKISKTPEKKSSSKTQKIIFKPMPSMQLLQSLQMYSPAEQHASSTKKLNIKPARTNELNLTEFTKSPKITTRNVRKQLWSVEKGDSKWTVEKGDKLRRVTVMKPGRESLRKSVYSKPSLMQPKKITTNKQTKSLSIDDTLPLMDMEQFTVTKIKRTLFSGPQTKPANQRKTTSHINVKKMPMVSSFAKKMIKPTTPTIVITPAEKSTKKAMNKTTSNNKPKIENEKKNDIIDVMFDKLTNIEDKMGSFDDIKALLCTICVHLGIEVPVHIFGKQQKSEGKQQTSEGKQQKSEGKQQTSEGKQQTSEGKQQTSEGKQQKSEGKQQKSEGKEQIINKNCSTTKEVPLLMPCFKSDISSTPLATISENVVNNTEFKEQVYKLSPFVIKQTSNISNETKEDKPTELKLSPCTSKVTNQLENIENDTLIESNSNLKLHPCIAKINNQLETSEVNQLEKNETDTFTESNANENNNNIEVTDHVETKLNLKETSPSTPTNQEENPLKPDDNFTPVADHKINNKVESTKKLKKTWITQFEQLEKKLLNNSNESVNLHSSPDDSPIPPLQIDKIVNGNDDDEDVEKLDSLKLKKSHSTSNISDVRTVSHRKNALFKSRETDLLTESIYVYNELRDELPKFLSTPVNKTNKTMNFMTPSVQGNEKKLISRRVQEQLLRLNDF